CGLVESAQSTVKITARTIEEQPSDSREHGITEIPVQPGHRIPLDTSFETVTHHQVETVTQLVEERTEVTEVVAVVGVPHDDRTAAGCLNPAEQGTAVTFFGHMN